MTHKEIMKHLLNGGKLIYGDCSRYEYLNDKGNLVYRDGSRAAFGSITSKYLKFEQPKYQVLYLSEGEIYKTTYNKFVSIEDAKRYITHLNENTTFIKLLKPEDV